MKVSEAKEKVCPFMSTPIIADSAFYQNGVLHKVNCMAGDCIAWEWETEIITEPEGIITRPKGTKSHGYNKENRLVWEKPLKDEGYYKRLK